MPEAIDKRMRRMKRLMDAVEFYRADSTEEATLIAVQKLDRVASALSLTCLSDGLHVKSRYKASPAAKPASTTKTTPTSITCSAIAGTPITDTPLAASPGFGEKRKRGVADLQASERRQINVAWHLVSEGLESSERAWRLWEGVWDEWCAMKVEEAARLKRLVRVGGEGASGKS
ncbi:hypothetical protein CLOM_g13413 [Closterium sp. NIES-68]|nr:hypothetical protein CLOM_g13413 [Closterium sp. NIES-68]GJP72426.1 hypothetical protein CLOP_g3161 [Closterium sp. NIES-67]